MVCWLAACGSNKGVPPEDGGTSGNGGNAGQGNGTPGTTPKIKSGLSGTIQFARSAANYQELVYAQKDVDWSEGEVIVMPREGITEQQVQQEVAQAGGDIVARKPNTPYYLVRSRSIKKKWRKCVQDQKDARRNNRPVTYDTGESIEDIHRESNAFVQKFRAKKRLFYNVAHNYMRKPSALNERQWALKESRIEEVWSKYNTKGSANVVVAVIDTGVRTSHPNLAGRLRLQDGYDFVNDDLDGDDTPGPDNNPDEPTSSNASFHGTHVAGIVAANPSTAPLILDGVAGGVSVLPIRVLGEDGGTDFDISQGILYAAGLLELENGKKIQQRADIINLSLGGPGESPILEDAIRRATAAGVVVVAAAGNEGTSALSYPAAYSDVIAVGATGPDHAYAPYSNYGPNVDIMAPGGGENSTTDENGDSVADGILSSWVRPVSPPGDISTVTFMSGTSMAAPFVAGIIGLMKTVKPTLTLPEIRRALFENAGDTAMPSGCSNRCGRGGLDLPKLFDGLATLPAAASKIQLAQDYVVGTPDAPTVTLRLNNVGTGALEILEGESVRIHASSKVDWLTVDTVKDAQGITLTFTFNKSKIGNRSVAALVDVITNAGEIDIAGSKDYSGVVQITAAYETSDVVHVALVKATDKTPVAWTYTSQTKGWKYQFELSTVGEYLIFAGKDSDNDGMICNAGDPCGQYASLEAPKKVNFTGNGISSGLDFKVELANGSGIQLPLPK